MDTTDNDGIATPAPMDNDGVDTSDNNGVATTYTDNDGMDTTDQDGIITRRWQTKPCDR